MHQKVSSFFSTELVKEKALYTFKLISNQPPVYATQVPILSSVHIQEEKCFLAHVVTMPKRKKVLIFMMHLEMDT